MTNSLLTFSLRCYGIRPLWFALNYGSNIKAALCDVWKWSLINNRIRIWIRAALYMYISFYIYNCGVFLIQFHVLVPDLNTAKIKIMQPTLNISCVRRKIGRKRWDVFLCAVHNHRVSVFLPYLLTLLC